MTAIAIVIMVFVLYSLNYSRMHRHIDTLLYFREQLVHMLGLSKLSDKLGPQTTVEILAFVVKYGPENVHRLTAAVSFGALAILLVIRQAKHRTHAICIPLTYT